MYVTSLSPQYVHSSRFNLLSSTEQARYIIFHFGNIEHAVQFRATLARHEDFEQCNLTFATDP